MNSCLLSPILAILLYTTFSIRTQNIQSKLICFWNSTIYFVEFYQSYKNLSCLFSTDAKSSNDLKNYCKENFSHNHVLDSLVHIKHSPCIKMAHDDLPAQVTAKNLGSTIWELDFQLGIELWYYEKNTLLK